MFKENETQYCKNCYELQQQLDKLKVENDELKKWRETVVELFEKTCRCKYLNEENAHCSFYDRECISINQCLYKNQQTLAKIKEIAEENKETAQYKGICFSILKKISEVEDG